MKPEISILAPCYNEAANLPELVERVGKAMAGVGAPFELVLVDDASSDDTYAVAERLKAAEPWIVIVKHNTNLGISEGWASALKASSGRYVVTIDADLQYRPEDIPLMWKAMAEHGPDLVQGWRASNPGGSKIRRIESQLFSALLNVIFNTGLSDIKSGFILYKREAFEKIIEDRKLFRYFQHFPTIAATARGMSIREVSIVFDQRHAGKSFITNSIAFGLSAMPDLPKAWRIYKKGRP